MHTSLYAGPTKYIWPVNTKSLHTLVTAMTLQRLPITEAMSAFEIPQNEEAKTNMSRPMGIHKLLP